MIALEESLQFKEESAIDPEGRMNVWTKCQGHPFISCWDILLKTTNVNTMIMFERRSGDHWSQLE